MALQSPCCLEERRGQALNVLLRILRRFPTPEVRMRFCCCLADHFTFLASTQHGLIITFHPLVCQNSERGLLHTTEGNRKCTFATIIITI
eukprot:1403336-Amphidinium_carterae.1